LLANFYALAPEGSRENKLLCRSGPCPRIFALWNQQETDTGFLLFAGMARSYIKNLLKKPLFIVQMTRFSAQAKINHSK